MAKWLHMLTSVHSFAKLIMKEGIGHSTHGYPVPRHPICVHSRVIAPAINYKSRLGSLCLKKWTNGFRTHIWVGLTHISSFPFHFPHRLQSPRTNLAVLSSFSTHCSSLLGSKCRWRPLGHDSQGAYRRVGRKRHGLQKQTDQDSGVDSTRLGEPLCLTELQFPHL